MILEILGFLGGALFVNHLLSNKQAKVIEAHAEMDREARKYKRMKSLALLDPLSPISIEDTRRRETEKRIAKAFEAQQEQMFMRALKQHAADCPDPLTCTKSPCFVWEPDKIVGEPEIVKIKTQEERMKEDTDNSIKHACGQEIKKDKIECERLLNKDYWKRHKDD